ncbi:MAG: glycosyltransferase family 2 protein [bacterium]
MNKVVIVIPAFNEAKVIGQVIKDIRSKGFAGIIVVDDGSTDKTTPVATQAGAIVVTHRFNRGKGAAIKTGLEAAKLLSAGIIVTIDGDGQHAASDIPALVQPIIDGRCQVVLGNRLHSCSSMPKQKIIQNIVGNAVTFLLHRQWVTDSQSGFRAYSRLAAELINTQADFYDYDSEVIREIRRHRISFQEVPVAVHYTPYSQSKSHKQTLANGVKTVYRMIWHLIS